MAKKYVSFDRLIEYDTLIKQEIANSVSGKADSGHSHDGRYYTETEIDTKISAVNTTIGNHNHDNSYDVKGSASNALASAKTYADNAATAVKNDLLNGAGEAYDTLKELSDLINDNQDAIDALEIVASGKANASHIHAIADVSGLQTALDNIDSDLNTLTTTVDGKSDSGHTHSASKITSGILVIERGGTGNMDGYIRAGQKDGTSVGALSTAEGRNVTASGNYCHAEGNYTYATGSSSHAEGQSTEANGSFSHAEGESSIAGGYASHAEGDHTIASGDCSHAQGKYNIEDTADTYAHIVGNGESASARSNAHTLDWSGNAWFAGDVTVGGASQNDGVRLVKSESIPSITYGSAEPIEIPETGEGSVYFRTGGDAVVEVGTSGIWTYRKWASGIAECWGKYICTGVTATSAWGSMYESNKFTLADYPFTFIDVPTQDISVISTGGSAFFLYVYGSYGPSTTSAGSVNFYRPTSSSSSQDVTLSIQTIGRWK